VILIDGRQLSQLCLDITSEQGPSMRDGAQGPWLHVHPLTQLLMYQSLGPRYPACHDHCQSYWW